MSGQVWQVDTLGGFSYSDELSNIMRTALQPVVKFRQFCDAKDFTEKGLGAGDLSHWNVYSDVQDAGGKLDEHLPMPETNFEISQGTIQVFEYGNSVPYTKLLDDLSKQPITEIIHKVLKNDAKKALDGDAFREFDKCILRVAPTGGSSTTAVTFENGVQSSITNDAPLNKAHIKLISDGMKERQIPAYMGDDYMAIAWPSTYRTFKDELETIKQYVETGFGFIMNGEIGRYESIRFIEQTHINKGGAYDSTAAGTYNPVAKNGADAWNNGDSDWCFFFGEDTVAEGIAIPEEIRGKLPGDYGRSKGVAWYGLEGFAIVHGDTDQQDQARIVKWDSAA